MKVAEVIAPPLRRGWRLVSAGQRLTWLHRMWFATILVIGIGYCYAFPPFQTNDEDAHWLHLWGVAYGHFRCDGAKPAAASQFLGLVHQKEVRNDPALWRWQYLRDARQFIGSTAMNKVEGTACRYPPHPYFVPAAIARLVAFGPAGAPRRGGILRAAYAVRITNWLLLSIAVLILCRRVPWLRNFALFFYSIPELIQQTMAVNTDSFLFVATAALLVLMFGSRAGPGKLIAIGIVVALMTVIKPVYASFGALGVVVYERLQAQRRWRWGDGAAMIAALALPFVGQWLWSRWLALVPEPPGAAVFDYGRTRAIRQMDFLHTHPGIVWTLLKHQCRDLFCDDLMRGNWYSIFGAFGWSMFTMARWGYYLLVYACGCAILVDIVDNQPDGGLPGRSRRTAIAAAIAAAAVLVSTIGIVIGMYIYFSGAFLNRIGADEVVGVQGRYYLVPILLWVALLVHVARRRRPLPRRWADFSQVGTATALFACVLANVAALHSILVHFTNGYSAAPPPAPFHY